MCSACALCVLCVCSACTLHARLRHVKVILFIHMHRISATPGAYMPLYAPDKRLHLTGTGTCTRTRTRTRTRACTRMNTHAGTRLTKAFSSRPPPATSPVRPCLPAQREPRTLCTARPPHVDVHPRRGHAAGLAGGTCTCHVCALHAHALPMCALQRRKGRAGYSDVLAPPHPIARPGDPVHPRDVRVGLRRAQRRRPTPRPGWSDPHASEGLAWDVC